MLLLETAHIVIVNTIIVIISFVPFYCVFLINIIYNIKTVLISYQSGLAFRACTFTWKKQ